MRKLALVAAAAGAIANAACSGGGGGGGGISIPPEEFGGFALVAVSSNGAFAQAIFVSDVTGGDGDPFEVEFATEECEAVVAQSTVGEPTITTMDVGAEISFETQGAGLVAARQTGPDGEFFYFGFSTADFPDDSDYTIENSGSAVLTAGVIGTISAPEKVVFEAPSFTPGQDVDIEWTGGRGADYIDININDANGDELYDCRTKNDGAFTIPGEATGVAGATEITISGPHFEVIDINGRKLVTAIAAF